MSVGVPLFEDAEMEFGDAEYVFAMFDNNEFGPADQVKQEVDDWKSCPDCKIDMDPTGSIYKCSNCGREEIILEQTDEYNASILENYNSNNSSSMSIKIIGKDSYRYRKGLYKTSSDYAKVQNSHTNKELNRFNSQSRGGKLPVIVLKAAADLYSKIQRCNIVKRGNGRRGALGACIGFVCDEHNISKKPKELAKFVNVEESYVSKGDRLLRKLHAEGKIDIPVHHDPKDSYIYQYFEALSIDKKYKEFVTELIDRASQVDMMGENNSRMSTKCAGAIYTLKLQEGLPFTKADIVENCKISKSTFTRYHEYLMLNRKLLKPIFKKHNIKPLKKKKKKNVLNMKKTPCEKPNTKNPNAKKPNAKKPNAKKPNAEQKEIA